MIDQIIEILFEEDNSRVVAIYGGGFKPPTKGHFSVVEKTLENFPEIDELKIFVGSGVRDGITQDQSIKLWDIYTKYLTPKIDIQSSIAPVKSIFDYSKEHPEEKIYWILGIREDNENDLKDLENRTKSLEKYPNIEVKAVITADGVSGTKARAALLSGNKEEFFKLIPDIEEKEQIWNLLTPVVKEEEITEVGEANLKPYEWKELARNSYYIYTAFTTDNGTEYEVDLKPTLHIDKDFNDVSALSVSFYAKPTDADRSSAYITVNKGELYKVMSTITDIIKTYAKEFKAGAIIYSPVKKSDEENFGTQRDKLYKAFLTKSIPGVEFEQGEEVVTAVLPNVKEASDPQAGTALPHGSGFAPVKESYQFKISDKNYDDEDNSLITVTYKFSTPDNNYRVEFYSGEYSPESKTFDVAFGLDKGYNFKLDTFQMTGENNALNILKTVVDIIIDFTNKFEVNKLVINPTSEKRGKVYSMILKYLPSNILNKIEPIKEVVTATGVICDNCGWKWKKADGGKDLYICHKCGHDNTPNKDPFGLKEYAKKFVKEVFKEDRNIKEGMLSLSKYMVNNGMNIKPLPKVKIIDNDAKNASDLLGKTAYYNPQEKSITLYTMNRHPKDVLRSFAHEMVHHQQNLEGRLQNITTQNINEDDYLKELEREAYEQGNLYLREWEDSIKNV